MFRISTRSILILALVMLAMLVLTFPEDAAAQCSMCKRALEASGKDRLITGFKWSIAFMVTPPLIITGMIGYIVMRTMRQQAADAGAAEGALTAQI